MWHSRAGWRDDDNEENFRNRFRKFSILTQPVVDRYQISGMICPCDATASEDEVASTLRNSFSRPVRTATDPTL